MPRNKHVKTSVHGTTSEYKIDGQERKRKQVDGLYWCRKCHTWVEEERMRFHKHSGASSGLCEYHYKQYKATKSKEYRRKKRIEKNAQESRLWWKNNKGE